MSGPACWFRHALRRPWRQRSFDWLKIENGPGAMAECGRQEVLSRFDPQHLTWQVEQIYRQFVRGATGTSETVRPPLAA